MAIETTGVFGARTTEFLKELGHRLRQVSGEANSFAYLNQRLSVVVQRGNAAPVLGTLKVKSFIFLYKYNVLKVFHFLFNTTSTRNVGKFWGICGYSLLSLL